MLIDEVVKVRGGDQISLKLDMDDANVADIVVGTILEWTAAGAIVAGADGDCVATYAGILKGPGMFYMALDNYAGAEGNGYIGAISVGSNFSADIVSNHAAQAVAMGDVLTITNGVWTKCTAADEMGLAVVEKAVATTEATDVWKINTYAFPYVLG